ncbi:MAG: hypothetical protein DRQ10_06880 [Candidatus Hydrothermota bacterium]|nr:MAG: hypothetical protein DRQ10_06880 [Candidatus Hydrothermae bacterium]
MIEQYIGKVERNIYKPPIFLTLIRMNDKYLVRLSDTHFRFRDFSIEFRDKTDATTAFNLLATALPNFASFFEKLLFELDKNYACNPYRVNVRLAPFLPTSCSIVFSFPECFTPRSSFMSFLITYDEATDEIRASFVSVPPDAERLIQNSLSGIKQFFRVLTHALKHSSK